MGLVLKKQQLCLLFFFCGWVALTQEAEAPGPSVKIDPKTIEETARKSMTESNILDELAEAATKNQGGAKAIKGIKGLKVKDIRPPNMTVSCVEDVGLSMSVVSQITIAGKSFIGGTMEITVRSNMTTKSKMEVTGPTEVKFEVLECIVDLLSCKTNLPSSMLPKIVNKFLNSTLGKVLPGMMCPAADKVVGLMKEKMLSVFEEAWWHLDIKTLILKNGEQIPIPTSPEASTSLPAKREDTTVVYLPVNVLNGAMEALKEVFDGPVSSGGTVVTTDTPAFALEEDRGTLTVPVRMEDSAAGRVVTMDVVARVTFAVSDEKLKTTMEMERYEPGGPASPRWTS
ncbi:hypothetical protein lerEdw1_005012 [Lerista edwardsae]|nr:hypothetical protein lerEdw1_005012 [Lerista edwardsae]